MPLLNYTTKVPSSTTIGQIQAMLVRAGATAIAIDYREGCAVGMAFKAPTPIGLQAFRLPVDAAPVEAVLLSQAVQPRFQTPEHAERVAWRILKDWIEAQLAIIETEMVTLDEVMLPYMQAGVDGRTVYDLYLGEQLALPAGPS